MASRYGFMTEEEVNREIEREKDTLNESHKKENERLEPIVAAILEEFAIACGFYKSTVVREDGKWRIMQGENPLVTIALDHAGQNGDYSLSITDEPLLSSETPHIIRNQKMLVDVLTRATDLKVSQNLPYYEPARKTV